MACLSPGLPCSLAPAGPQASGDAKGRGRRRGVGRTGLPGQTLPSEGPSAISAPRCPSCLPQAPRGWANDSSPDFSIGTASGHPARLHRLPLLLPPSSSPLTRPPPHHLVGSPGNARPPPVSTPSAAPLCPPFRPCSRQPEGAVRLPLPTCPSSSWPEDTAIVSCRPQGPWEAALPSGHTSALATVLSSLLPFSLPFSCTCSFFCPHEPA